MSFEQEMRRATVQINAACEKTLRATALQLFTQVIERTPVDTGTARGNWRTNVGSVNPSTSESRRGAQAVSEASLATAQFTLADTIFLSNNLPYIGPLENGSSTQAPQGMVAVTVDAFERVIESEARRNRV